MSRATVYLLFAVAGTIVPYMFFARFFATEGVGLSFLGALFANDAAGGFTTDLIISSCVFWLFVATEGARAGVSRRWVYVLLNLTVGLSCALPFFLWARERALGRSA